MWRKVVKSEIQEGGGNSIYKSWVRLGCVWILDLECGHQVTRQPRYVENSNARGRGWTRRRNSDDALPAPKRVQCHLCER